MAILNYQFQVEIVSETSNLELNDAFDRLNRNVKQLNKQELRHAQYNGRFITKMEELAASPEWRNLGISTDSRVRRMQDVEYVSEFYLVCVSGIQDGKDYLDRAYSDFDTEIPDESKVDVIYAKTLDFIKKVDEVSPLRSTRYSNIADFYSLWAAVSQKISTESTLPTPESTSEKLLNFVQKVTKDDGGDGSKYLAAAIQGSNKKPNRQLRADIISRHALTV